MGQFWLPSWKEEELSHASFPVITLSSGSSRRSTHNFGVRTSPLPSSVWPWCCLSDPPPPPHLRVSSPYISSTHPVLLWYVVMSPLIDTQKKRFTSFTPLCETSHLTSADPELKKKDATNRPMLLYLTGFALFSLSLSHSKCKGN